MPKKAVPAADDLAGQLAVVLEATADLNRMLAEPERLYAGLLGHLRRAVPFFSGSLQVMEQNAARIIAFLGDMDPQVVMGLRFPMDPLFPNYEVVRTRKPVAYADIRVAYPHFHTRREEFNSGHIRSWLGVPMIAGTEVIGMIALDRVVVDPFSPDAIDIVMSFANQAAVAIQNSRTYRELQGALAVQDGLMREMHHRIKNNLQLVSSLVELHSGQLQDEPFREKMEKLQVRISAIAAIHEQLYNRSENRTVDLKTYLGSLAAEILASFQRSDAVIELRTELQSVSADLSSGVSLGLIVSELLMNSLKYAFPGNAPGTVRLSLREADGEATLVFEDSGVGIQTRSGQEEGFGTLLIHNLAAQIHGRAELESRPGRTAWTISFTLAP